MGKFHKVSLDLFYQYNKEKASKNNFKTKKHSRKKYSLPVKPRNNIFVAMCFTFLYNHFTVFKKKLR